MPGSNQTGIDLHMFHLEKFSRRELCQQVHTQLGHHVITRAQRNVTHSGPDSHEPRLAKSMFIRHDNSVQRGVSRSVSFDARGATLARQEVYASNGNCHVENLRGIRSRHKERDGDGASYGDFTLRSECDPVDATLVLVLVRPP